MALASIDMTKLSADALRTLAEGGFLDEDCPADEAIVGSVVGARCAVYAADDELLPEARRLACALRRHTGDSWSAIPAYPSTEPADLCCVVSPRESGPDLVRSLLEKGPVLLSGECNEGLHVGPIVATEQDFERYLRATLTWSDVASLEGFGFEYPWPTQLLREIRRDADRVARCILTCKRSPPLTCVLVEGERVVRLWTTLEQSPPSWESLQRELGWSKGTFVDYQLYQSSIVPQVWLGSCRTPFGGDPYLEPQFGKGLTREGAAVTTMGEAMERFSAFLARPEYSTEVPAGERKYELHDFHPFGSYDDYRRSPNLIAMTPAQAFGSGERVWVPASLVYDGQTFQEPHGTLRPTGSTSSGQAFYPSLEGAVLRGLLEVLERDDFYPNLVQLVPGVQIDATELGARRDAVDFAACLRACSERGLRVWLVRYGRRSPQLPIVHAFVLHPGMPAMSRGAGSGVTWAGAATRALLEAVQLFEQFSHIVEQGDQWSSDEGFVSWMRQDVITMLEQHLASFASGPVPEDLGSETELFALAKASVPEVLVVRFPQVVVGCHGVLVLVPGATCHSIPSDSRGGGVLQNPRFPHPIPV